jgi:hypothetical protein
MVSRVPVDKRHAALVDHPSASHVRDVRCIADTQTRRLGIIPVSQALELFRGPPVVVGAPVVRQHHHVEIFTYSAQWRVRPLVPPSHATAV